MTVETVIDLAATRNPAEITTMDIARRMGVTQGALFRHFPSKDAILQSVMEWVSARLMARIDKVASAGATPLASLEAVFLTHVDFIARHPGVPRMLFGELQRAEQTPAKQTAQNLLRRYDERLCQIIAAGKECGELSAATDDEAAATLFIGVIQGLVVQGLLTGNMRKIREDAPGVFRLYRQAVAATN